MLRWAAGSGMCVAGFLLAAFGLDVLVGSAETWARDRGLPRPVHLGLVLMLLVGGLVLLAQGAAVAVGAAP